MLMSLEILLDIDTISNYNSEGWMAGEMGGWYKTLFIEQEPTSPTRLALGTQGQWLDQWEM